jgi:PIN domain nuclease of toxin-antitoxin system
MEKALTDLGGVLLSISIEHADAQLSLPFVHRDPFDRLLVAQAKVENLHLVSNESVFDQYGIARLW